MGDTVHEELFRKVIAREVSEGGGLLNSTALLAGAVVRKQPRGVEEVE